MRSRKEAPCPSFPRAASTCSSRTTTSTTRPTRGMSEYLDQIVDGRPSGIDAHWRADARARAARRAPAPLAGREPGERSAPPRGRSHAGDVGVRRSPRRAPRAADPEAHRAGHGARLERQPHRRRSRGAGARGRAGGVPVPAVAFALEPADELGQGFVMERIEGETIPRKLLRDPAYAGAPSSRRSRTTWLCASACRCSRISFAARRLIRRSA